MTREVRLIVLELQSHVEALEEGCQREYNHDAVVRNYNMSSLVLVDMCYLLLALVDLGMDDMKCCLLVVLACKGLPPVACYHCDCDDKNLLHGSQKLGEMIEVVVLAVRRFEENRIRLLLCFEIHTIAARLTFVDEMVVFD